MLERFKVPHEDQVRVPEPSLRATVTAIFEKMGVSPEDAAEGANTLVMADLRGVETHGVSNMLRAYVQRFNEGTLKARPNWRIVRESPGTAVVDADGGLGIILGPKVMRIAIEKARRVGVGVVTMFGSGHTGAIGHHAMLAAQANMVGVCMTGSVGQIPPTFGAEPRLGTNPIAIAAPARREPFLLFDAATSVVAANKIGLANRVGASLLGGWIAGSDGTPILEDIAPPPRGQFMILPLGSTREMGSHKGYGFALMAETLATLLGGALPHMLDPGSGSKTFFAAYNITAFTDPDQFKDDMDRMLKTLRTTRPAPGHERVLYPGLPEHEEEMDRRANGIPLHREVVEWFDGIAGELSVPRLTTL